MCGRDLLTRNVGGITRLLVPFSRRCGCQGPQLSTLFPLAVVGWVAFALGWVGWSRRQRCCFSVHRRQGGVAVSVEGEIEASARIEAPRSRGCGDDSVQCRGCGAVEWSAVRRSCFVGEAWRVAGQRTELGQEPGEQKSWLCSCALSLCKDVLR